MKTVTNMVLAAVIVLTLTVSAVAFGGPGMGPGAKTGTCQNLTPEQTQKMSAFQQEIAPLREKKLKIRAELAQLYAQPNPDWKAINEKQKEIIDIRTQIQQKAHAAGLPAMGIGKGKCKGMMGHDAGPNRF